MRTWKELDARQVLCPSPSTPTLTSHLRTAGREGGPEALGPEEGGGLAHQSPQARVSGISNSVTTASVGSLLCVAYAATKTKAGSLTKE